MKNVQNSIAPLWTVWKEVTLERFSSAHKASFFTLSCQQKTVKKRIAPLPAVWEEVTPERFVSAQKHLFSLDLRKFETPILKV